MAVTKERKKGRFSTYLIKTGVENPSGIVKSPFTAHDVTVDGAALGTLYVRRAVPKAPAWLKLFEDVGAKIPKGLRNQHTAAVLLVNVRRRVLAVTFGYGWMLLRSEAIVDNFGLRVALNSIDADRIKSIDRTTLDALTRHTRSQSTRSGSQDQFDIREEQDLLRAIVGMPRDRQLGSPVAGADSLQLHVAADLRGLRGYLQTAVARYSSKDYQRHFEWIDYITAVRDPSLRARLDEKLTAAVATQDSSALYLAVPDIIDWHETSGFRYSERGAILDDIHFSSLLRSLRSGADIDADRLRTRYIRQIGRTSDAVVAKWSAYRCINFETTLAEATYLLTAGKWYAVEQGFVDRTNRRMKRIRLASVELPDYSDKDEKAYNKRAEKESSGEFACVDRKNVPYGGGRSSIEFCDLYGRDGSMIHVKRYTGSPTLSHLFTQGIVPALAMLRDADFRRAVNKKALPVTRLIKNVQRRPDPKQHAVIYAIVARSKTDLRESLPFFSKVALLAARDRLSEGVLLRVNGEFFPSTKPRPHPVT